MSSKHHHGFVSTRSSRLVITIVLNLFITVAQVIGALLSNSLALLSDALHNFSDTSSLVLSYIAIRLTRKESTAGQTFGFRRAEIIAAFINASLLLVIAIFLIVAATRRILSPEIETVDGLVVMILAGFSIIANGLSVLVIKKDSENNMNLRSAYLHLFTDMLSSIAVLIGGLVVFLFDITVADHILSIMIAVYLIIASWKLVLQSLKVLMQFTPSGIDIEKIANSLEKLSLVKNIHHAHAWQLNDDEIYFEAHVEMTDNMMMDDVCSILEEMREILLKEYNINHATFQPEFDTDCHKKLIWQEMDH